VNDADSHLRDVQKCLSRGKVWNEAETGIRRADRSIFGVAQSDCRRVTEGFKRMAIVFSRRQLLVGSLACGAVPSSAWAARTDWYIGTIPDRPFDIKIVDKKRIPARFHRQSVAYSGSEPIGTIVINKQERMLYYIDGPGRAVRYGVAVGRDGRRWSGEAIIARRAKWPGWTPTANMRRRDPSLPSHVPGGPRNPLGARALYLYRDGRDTLYRVHGTHEPWSIGKFASSGCIRMLNEHVFELFGTVRDGARVVVM
jgi:lipoprotein-anchoring transpeptidase ErfK/SrfK